jgi:hypothetical protein
VERFLNKVCKTENCWLWTGAIHTNGYGVIGVGSRTDNTRRTEYAHRLSYMFYVAPIAEGMEIDHVCRNRVCVNPDHLRVVTHKDNIVYRYDDKCAKGHPFTEDNTYYRKDNGYRQCRACRRFRKQNGKS